MTPAIAIKLECRWCMGSVRSFSCDSQICKLNNQSLTPLRRIKAHCLDCVETKQEIPKIKAGVTSHLERFKFSKRHATIV
ncbi:hypothetical protein FBQ80_03775 [Candidatus Brocadia sp. AMX2]|uniref:hypothetical protein n=1 Tax=Candidatus Brocadia sp. AMX2 TaxID=2293635 RepID=UPI002557601C|nr:hypothetical protein [Candidatus Brocadia sp. AMX2]MDL1934698.1 hypothetical protein [Candidatus Brocadia sp. AMX2]